MSDLFRIQMIGIFLFFSRLLHFRLDMYGFAPLYEIRKEEHRENGRYTALPYYGKFLHSFKYMGEAALVLQLPFASISLYANGYSYPSQNFNFANFKRRVRPGG